MSGPKRTAARRVASLFGSGFVAPRSQPHCGGCSLVAPRQNPKSAQPVYRYFRDTTLTRIASYTFFERGSLHGEPRLLSRFDSFAPRFKEAPKPCSASSVWGLVLGISSEFGVWDLELCDG